MTQLLNAFAPGADLWVIPNIEANWWSQHIDWKLNFQIAKSYSRKPTRLAPRLEKVLDACGLDKKITPSKASSLLIESKHILPNRWVLMLDSDWTNSDSIQQLVNQWKGLQKPSMRVFLPKDINKKQALVVWQKLSAEKSGEIDFVEDPNRA